MIRVQQEPFDAGAELQKLKAGNSNIGGTVMFLGTVRDLSDGTEVRAMTLEHYPGMTEKALSASRRKRKGAGRSMAPSSSTAMAGSSPEKTSCSSSRHPRIARPPSRPATS